MRLGVDLGGTKTEIAALDGAGRVAFRRRLPTPSDYEGVLARIAALVAEAEAAAGPAASVGIGAPGSIRPETGLLAGSNLACLNGRALDRDLAAALAPRPTALANDADCFALAEAAAGAGQGAASVFGAILGTGVGGGIVIGGRLHAGAGRAAGEWGHMPLPAPRDGERPGPLCHCGRRGCVEAWVSGPALAADHARATGRALAPPEIAAAAGQGDAPAAAALARHADRLARALGTLVTVLDPEVVVLGGGLSALPGLAERLAEALPPYAFAERPAARIAVAALGDSAGVLGAARLPSG